MAQVGAAPSLQQEESRAIRLHFRGSVPPVLLFVGVVYAALSGAIFLGNDAHWAPVMWAATAALGGLLAGTSWLLRRGWTPTDTVLAVVVAGEGMLLMAHDLVLIGLAEDPGQAAYLVMLLAGLGYFLLPRGALAAVQAFTVAGWVAVARALDLPFDGEATRLLVFGIALGWAANAVRTRHLRRAFRASRAFQSTLSESEERFRSLAETAKDAILLLDAEGRMTYLNPAGQALFGLRPGESDGRFLSQHLGQQALAPEALLGTRELVAQRRDGSQFPAEISLARMEREGKVAYTGVLRDVTERKRAAEASHQAATREAEMDHLREMNEFKTRFLNMAAHELNTPLTPLRLQLHLLKAEQMGPLTEKQAKAVSLLDRNVTRLAGLVAELLEVARLQSGRLKLAVKPVALDEVVDEVVDSFAEASRRVGITLGFAGAQNLNVQADRNRTVQVLFNIVSNAIKFTPSGGSVTIEAAERDGRVEVAVTDTGLGLTSEQQARLFQPFSQVHDPMSVTTSGTGLGLYICKGLLEAQGGTIAVSSRGPGQGSTFRFTLPAAEAAVVQPRVVPAAAVGEDPIVRRLRELI